LQEPIALLLWERQSPVGGKVTKCIIYFPVLLPLPLSPPFSVMLDLVQHLIPDPEINSG